MNIEDFLDGSIQVSCPTVLSDVPEFDEIQNWLRDQGLINSEGWYWDYFQGCRYFHVMSESKYVQSACNTSIYKKQVLLEDFLSMIRKTKLTWFQRCWKAVFGG